MLRKILALSAVAVLLLLTSVVKAQEVVTMVLRDGQRLTGEVPDLNSSGFIFRSNGQDRTIPVGNVAAIEYAPGEPPAEARARLDAGQPLVVLRNGTIVDGRLVDIGGDFPKRLRVETPSGPREILSIEVAKVYLYYPTNTPAPAAQAAAAAAQVAETPKGAITVPATQAWTSTGIRVRKGDQFQITGTGDINIGNNASSGVGGSPAATIPTIKYPLQSAPVGALIARIDQGQPFAVVNVPQPVTMPDNGTLFLGINDDHVQDNSGAYTVTVLRTNGRK